MEELFKDIGNLSVVTKLADHVIEVRNLKLKLIPIANKHKTFLFDHHHHQSFYLVKITKLVLKVDHQLESK